MLQGKLQRSKLVRLSSSLSRLTVSLADTVVGRGESELKARTADQLVPTSPVAKTIFPNRTQIVIDVYPKVTNRSFKNADAKNVPHPPLPPVQNLSEY